MKYSYKITKYNPSSKIYDEWTSISDIKDISLYQEYINVESAYINSVLEICKRLFVSSLVIKELEIKQDSKFSAKFTNNQQIDVLNIDVAIRHILREQIWCKLISENCEIHFGYDYYMYVVCKNDMQDIFKHFPDGIHAEKFESPYLAVS